jgi:hypothetical protein
LGNASAIGRRTTLNPNFRAMAVVAAGGAGIEGAVCKRIQHRTVAELIAMARSLIERSNVQA